MEPHEIAMAENEAERRYNMALRLASKPGIDPETWYAEWSMAYLEAAALDLCVVQGISAIKEFLYAVMERIAPTPMGTR